MDDMKDKVKGFMKKVNNPFTSSSSGRFKGQGRVLGSSSSSSATTGTVNSIPNRRIPGLDSSKKNVTPANSSNSRALSQKPSSNPSDKEIERPSNYVSDKNVQSRTGANSNSEENARTRTGFDPFDSLITSSNRNPNGYSLNVFECPVCGRGYGTEEEVSGHIEHCLSLSSSGAVEQSLDGKNGLDLKSELETCVGAYVSGKPSEGSVEVILKLFKNVIKEPDNAKFRKIRMGNSKIKEAIGDAAGAVELLECVGFKLEEESGEMWAVMGVPSQDMLTSIKNVVSLLERPNGEELSSTAPEKVDETEKLKDIEPKEVDRQIRVFVSVSESTAAKIELPDSFYNLSREELKREADMRRKKIDDSQLLIPRSYREKQAKAARKKHTKTVIRVQFPDGVVLQGIFLPSEPTTALYEFVSAALKDPSLEFELMHPVPIKRRVIPHSPAPGQRPITLEEEDLVPAALIKCRPIETESAVFTGLCNELLEIIEPFSSQP